MHVIPVVMIMEYAHSDSVHVTGIILVLIALLLSILTLLIVDIIVLLIREYVCCKVLLVLIGTTRVFVILVMQVLNVL